MVGEFVSPYELAVAAENEAISNGLPWNDAGRTYIEIYLKTMPPPRSMYGIPGEIASVVISTAITVSMMAAALNR